MSNQLKESNSTSLIAVIEKVALDPSVDVDKMSKIIDMQERIYNKNAEIAFSEAMSQCQKAMPSVARDAVNKQTNSTYAKFETILEKVKPVYTKYGFSLSYGTDTSPMEGYIRITCDVMHEKGCQKQVYVDLPKDTVGIKGTANKTVIHGTGSTYSYAKRYLITMIFNIAIADEDDDGVSAGSDEFKKQVQQEMVNYFKKFTNAINRNMEAIIELKVALANDDLFNASGIWYDMSEQDQCTLYLAPSKGGILTTKEREQIKSSEFGAASRQHTRPAIKNNTTNGRAQ